MPPAVAAVLLANGITNASQARFFTNAADTTTKGWEATANWRGGVGPAKLDLTFAYGRFDQSLDALRGNPVLPALPIRGQISLGIILATQPKDKFTFNGSAEVGRWRFTANVSRYGTLITPDTGQVFSAEWMADVSLGYAITDRVKLLAGVINLTNNYPDEVVPNPDGRRYSELSPIAVEGREYFVRLSTTF